MNDKTEFLYSFELLINILSRKISNDPNNVFLKYLSCRIKEKEEGFSIFGGNYAIISFSSENNIMSQFMMYANNCSGYSLGLKTKLLLDKCHVINENNNEDFRGSHDGFDFGTEILSNHERFHIGRVIYNINDQQKLIEILLEEGEKKYNFTIHDLKVNIKCS